MSNSPYNYIPYGRQTISEQDIQAVIEVLRSPMLTQGPIVPQFEKTIAEDVNAQYGIAVNSATSALHIACLALGLGPGDWLWTSPISFVASANCGLYCGASVDFVDIELSTGLMDINHLEYKLEQAEIDGKLPKIVVPVHLAGTSCDMEAIALLAKKYGFYVLEDASHAIGGSYKHTRVGSCYFSDICVFSFHPVKIITSGEGGMATTNDSLLAEKMYDFRSHGITKDPRRFAIHSDVPWKYEQQSLGFNYRLTDIQAALGLSQHKRLDQIVLERNRLHHAYQALFKSLDLPIRLLNVPDQVISSVHLAVMVMLDFDPSNHLALFQYLRESLIGVQLHYSPIHLQPFYRQRGFKVGMFPRSEKYAQSAMSLPLYPGLTEQEQIRCAQSINIKLTR